MGTLKLAFGLAIIGCTIVACMKLIPPYFANYELDDAIKTEATRSTYSNRTEEDIRESIIRQARAYDIALTPQQVHVTRVGGYGVGSLSIEADYSIPVDFPGGFSTTLQFHPASKNNGVY
jgi:hypothetical protein